MRHVMQIEMICNDLHYLVKQLAGVLPRGCLQNQRIEGHYCGRYTYNIQGQSNMRRYPQLILRAARRILDLHDEAHTSAS